MFTNLIIILSLFVVETSCNGKVELGSELLYETWEINAEFKVQSDLEPTCSTYVRLINNNDDI